jgi:hypothetical protein
MIVNSGALEMIENIAMVYHDKNEELSKMASSFIETYMKYVVVDDNSLTTTDNYTITNDNN